MNYVKLLRDIVGHLPNLGKEYRILVDFLMPIIRNLGEESDLLHQDYKALKDQLFSYRRTSSGPISWDVNLRSEEGGVRQSVRDENLHNLWKVKMVEVFQIQSKDAPPIITEVTENQIKVENLTKRSLCWQTRSFEQQLGLKVKAFTQILHTYQMIPSVVGHWLQVMLNKLTALFGIFDSFGRKVQKEMGGWPDLKVLRAEISNHLVTFTPIGSMVYAMTIFYTNLCLYKINCAFDFLVSTAVKQAVCQLKILE